MSYDLRAWSNLSVPSDMTDAPAPVVPAAPPAAEAARPRPPAAGIAVPHHEQFASNWSAGFRKYWSRSDEATRDNWDNALAMRRDAFTEEMISLRTYPVSCIPWVVEAEDEEDPEQHAVTARLTKLLKSIPHLQDLKLWLLESCFTGKSAVQVVLERTLVDGTPAVNVTYWEPVSGDSLVYDFDGTPSILVRAGWQAPPGQQAAVIEQADRGRVLMLRDPFWRDRFIIMKFRRSGADYMFEGDLAGSMHGKGLRSRTYYAWLRRQNYMAWRENAAQRFPINGTLVAYYPQGDAEARDEAINAVVMMAQQNVSAFPIPANQKGDFKWFERLDAPTSGYEQFEQIIGDIEGTIRRCWLGQEGSSTVQPMGLGSEGSSKLLEGTREAYMRYDAGNLDETLTDELLVVLIKHNEWTYRGKVYKGTALPFKPRLVSLLDKANVAERAQAIDTGHAIGLDLSKKQLYKDLALAPPEDAGDALAAAPATPEGLPGMPGMPGEGAPGLPGADHAQGPGPDDAPRRPLKVARGADGKPRLRLGGPPKGDAPLAKVKWKSREGPAHD